MQTLLFRLLGGRLFGGRFSLALLRKDDFFRLFQRLFHPIILIFDVDEVSVDLVDRLDEGEGVVVFCENVAEFDELALVDDA